MKITVKDYTVKIYEVEVGDSQKAVRDALDIIRYYAKEPIRIEHWQEFHNENKAM